MTDSSTVFFLMMPHPPTSTPFPSPTLFRSYAANEEVIERWYKADEPHLDPDAPLIREDFDRNDPFATRYPRRISDHQISDIIRIAAEAAGVREPNEGNPFRSEERRVGKECRSRWSQ